MKEISFLILISLLVSSVSCDSNCTYQQKLESIQSIDKNIETYERMKFMNENLFTFGIPPVQKKDEEVFEQVKLRKLTSLKIDVSQELNQVNKSLNRDQQKVSQNLIQKALLNDLTKISAFSIPSKRLEGVNFYNHVLFQINDHFLSIQGDKLYSIPQISSQTKDLSKKKLPQTLISSVRNENFYTAQYFESDSVRNSQKCLSLKISQIQMKSREIKASTELEYNNLIVENIACASVDSSTFHKPQIYSHFFTFSSYQNKRVYFILINDHQFHFYLYSEKAQQLVLDQNKTIHLSELIEHAQKEFKITKVIRMNTHLIVTTDQNDLFSINLISFLNSKKKDYLSIFESLDKKTDPILDLTFNDNDFRFFFAVTSGNIYQYHINQHKIFKKFALSHHYCPRNEEINPQISCKCIQNVYVLENYLLVQYRENHYDPTFELQSMSFSFTLHDKESGVAHAYKIPFSHEKKCSSNKKIIFSKNKNSHYILTLACFIKENLENSFKTNDFLIIEHLNLETSDQSLPQGQLGGIDFSKFRLPMIVFSIGLICYITIKRNSKKSPQKSFQEEKMNQKFQEEIRETIKREKERQQNLQAIRANKSGKVN